MPKQTFFNLPNKKRKKIIEAAMKEFSDKSFKKVTIDNIVDRAEIPKGSFYQYFSNKEDIYHHLYNSMLQEKKKELKSLMKVLENLSFSDFMRQMFLKGIEFDLEKKELTDLREKFFLKTSQDLREEIIDDMINHSNELFTEIIEFYIKKGELKRELDIDLTANILSSMIIFFSKKMTAEKYTSKEEIYNVVEKMLFVIENGIKK
ncbi:MAG: TetR/AcrR family transcriptional regulator [Thermotogota bacterium]